MLVQPLLCSMKCIVLFGAGKSSSVLIDYLKQNSEQYNWQVFVADASLETAYQKTGEHELVTPVQADVYDEEERASLVQKADVVISLLPPSLHILVAKDCVAYSRHLLTASYIDGSIRALETEIKNKGLLFLCEMGLDPGIDHMSAMQMIHRIQSEGGMITSFKSHCGGLVAPESDDNPWHYKISWNPRNIIIAGKAGAVYKENGKMIEKQYNDVFKQYTTLNIPNLSLLGWYPNRDSTPYIELYGLHKAHTFIRTTLRRFEFMLGWQNVIDLKLTDDTLFYDTNQLSIADFLEDHFEKVDFEKWRAENPDRDAELAEKLDENLQRLKEEEQLAGEKGKTIEPEFMVVSSKGELINIDYENDIKKATDTVEMLYWKAAMALEQLAFLGIDDEETFINKGVCSVTDILQFILENKLALQPHDKDMVVMLHEIEYTINNKEKKQSSYLVVKGENSTQTAMAKTVGLPLGIAAKLLLEGSLAERGLHIPITPSIYNPVLDELKRQGIGFTEF